MTDPEVGTGPGDELSRSNAATDRRGLVSRFRGRGDFAGIAALVALVFAYLSPALKDGGAFGSYDLVLPLTTLGNGLFSGAPHNALSSDGVSQMIAWNAFDWRAVHHLQFPLWNDLTLLGVPHFANFESAVLSLPDVVSYLAPLKYAFLVAVAVKLLLAGTGTYAFCRVLGLRPLASTFGGATFMLSGAFSSWLTWPLSDVMSWTGWIATLCVLSYRLPDRRRYVALLAGATAFCLYGGFPEAYVFVMVTMAVLFGVASAFALFRRAGLSFSGVLRVAFGVGAGGMLATPLLLPGLQVINLAHRETESGFPGAPARSLAMAVAPGYYGLPIKGSTFFLNRSNYYETAVAIGVVALVLAVVAVLRWPRHPAVVALVLASVVALAVSYQTSSFDPVQSFLNHHGLGAVEWLRMRLVLGFTIGVLAAIGLETVTRLSREKRVVAGYLASAVLWAAVVALLAGHGLPKSAPRALRSLREQSLLWPVATVGVTAVAGALLLIARGRRRPRRHGASFGLAGIAATVLTGTQAGFLIFSGVGLNSYSHAF